MCDPLNNAANLMTDPIRFFAEFFGKYPLREPNLRNQRYPDELELLSEKHGIFFLTTPPMKDVKTGTPSGIHESFDGLSKYLWVIKENGIPMIMEKSEKVGHLHRGNAAHTNLTGNGKTYCGGEIWFKNDSTFWLSVGSSRFGPQDAEELADAETAFEKMGYKVISFGWDKDTNTVARSYRGA